MKSGTQTAIALACGYLLGRRRKMRMGLMLAAAAMTPGLGGVGGQLARKGTKALGSTDLLGKLSPELGGITGLVKGDLADAGKAAAMTAVNSRIEALTDRIHDQAEAWREALPASADAGEVAEDGPRPGARRRRESAGPARDEEEAGPARDEEEAGPARDEEEAEEAGPARDEEYNDDNGEAPPPRERASRGRTPTRRSGESARRSGKADRTDEPARTRSRPARSGAAASDSPVVRRGGRRS